MSLLRGIRVLELAGPFGSSCTHFLGSLGAEVVKVFLSGLGTRWAETAYARHQDADKRQLHLSADRLSDLTTLRELAAEVDILVESAPPGVLARFGLDYAALSVDHPGLIHASITAFGSDPPYGAYCGEELVASAMGGVLRMVGYPDRAPVKEALDACGFHAGAAAAAGLLLAYYERTATGRGQHVDISVQEVAASRTTSTLLLWQFDRKRLARSGHAISYGRATVRCIWPLADGFAFHSLMSGKFGAPANAALSAWMDECSIDNPLRDVDWSRYDRGALPAEVRAVWESAIAIFFRSRSKHDIDTEGRRRGINACVLQSPEDVLADPQLAARGFLRRSVCEGEEVRMPDHFVRVTRPENGADGPAAARARGRTEPESERLMRGVEPGALALAGVRVLDLSWALVGSLTTKALADHGAVVVKVESATRPCLTRTDAQVAVSTRDSFDDKPWFAHLNTGKLSLRLNLKHPRARTVIDPLIAWADVVVENFSPGTLEKLGLDYATLQRTRPDLVMVSGSVYGQTGPRARDWGVDGTGAALSGRMLLTGFPDRPPITPGAVPYGDVVMPPFMVAALAAALAERKQSGRGCHIDAAMVEICAHQTAEALLGAQLGSPTGRCGNRDPRFLLQGVYPTQGEDRWIAVSIVDADAWQRFTALLPGSFPDASAVAAADERARDRLDECIGHATRTFVDRALMHELQARGIAAGVVQDAEEVLERDPQLRSRQAFVPLLHPLLGRFAHQRTPYQLSRAVAQMQPAPLLGQHTEQICRELLGLEDAHVAELASERLFY